MGFGRMVFSNVRAVILRQFLSDCNMKTARAHIIYDTLLN
jgi:hypothetical protein